MNDLTLYLAGMVSISAASAIGLGLSPVLVVGTSILPVILSSGFFYDPVNENTRMLAAGLATKEDILDSCNRYCLEQGISFPQTVITNITAETIVEQVIVEECNACCRAGMLYSLNEVIKDSATLI